MRSGDHLLELIDDVLDLSSIESGKATGAINDIEVNSIALMASAAVAALVEENDVRLHRPTMAKKYYVKADRTHLLQAITNLLSNAIKYNQKNGEVNLSYGPLDGDTIRISVSENGPGIPEDKFKNLFMPFDRLGMESLTIKGTGVGLTIVKRLVEAMNGKIGVESKVGEGANFFIDLPIGESVEDSCDESDTFIFEPGLNPLGQERVVLCVDDNIDNLELVTQVLGKLSHVKIDTAKGAKEGIDWAVLHKPDLILMDINMQGIDGLAALRELKGKDETRGIPVVAISARALKHEVDEGLEAGFADYITKPFKMSELLQLVDGFLSVD